MPIFYGLRHSWVDIGIQQTFNHRTYGIAKWLAVIAYEFQI